MTFAMEPRMVSGKNEQMELPRQLSVEPRMEVRLNLEWEHLFCNLRRQRRQWAGWLAPELLGHRWDSDSATKKEYGLDTLKGPK